MIAVLGPFTHAKKCCCVWQLLDDSSYSGSGEDLEDLAAGAGAGATYRLVRAVVVAPTETVSYKGSLLGKTTAGLLQRAARGVVVLVVATLAAVFILGRVLHLDGPPVCILGQVSVVCLTPGESMIAF